MKKICYKLDNIDCAACALKIEDKVNRLEGVHFCNINYISLKLIVIFDENTLTEELLKCVILKSLNGVKIIGQTYLEVTDKDIELQNQREVKTKRIIFGKKKRK